MSIPAYVEQASIPPASGELAEAKEKGYPPPQPHPAVCATCTRCGLAVTVKCEVRNAYSVTKRMALNLLAEKCPRDSGDYYRDRVIPRGITVWFPHLGKLYPAAMSRATVCTVAGPVLRQTPLDVIPDGAEFKEAAEIFARKLKRKYRNTVLRPVGYGAGEKVPATSELSAWRA